MLLIFLQLTPWLVYYLLQILCEFERQFCTKLQGNVSSFICDKHSFIYKSKHKILMLWHFRHTAQLPFFLLC